MKKVLIASDIHGSSYYCGWLLDRIEEHQPDRVVLLGDLLYHGPRNDLPKGYEPKDVISMLNGIRDKLLCVRGNCDTEVDQMVLDFPALSRLCRSYAGRSDGLRSPTATTTTSKIRRHWHRAMCCCADTHTFPAVMSTRRSHT